MHPGDPPLTLGTGALGKYTLKFDRHEGRICADP